LENSAEHFTSFKEMIEKGASSPARKDGDWEAASKQASKTIEAFYELPTLSHGQMEPLNFYAHVQETKWNCMDQRKCQTPLENRFRNY